MENRLEGGKAGGKVGVIDLTLCLWDWSALLHVVINQWKSFVFIAAWYSPMACYLSWSFLFFTAPCPASVPLYRGGESACVCERAGLSGFPAFLLESPTLKHLKSQGPACPSPALLYRKWNPVQGRVLCKFTQLVNGQLIGLEQVPFRSRKHICSGSWREQGSLGVQGRCFKSCCLSVKLYPKEMLQVKEEHSWVKPCVLRPRSL